MDYALSQKLSSRSPFAPKGQLRLSGFRTLRASWIREKHRAMFLSDALQYVGKKESHVYSGAVDLAGQAYQNQRSPNSLRQLQSAAHQKWTEQQKDKQVEKNNANENNKL